MNTTSTRRSIGTSLQSAVRADPHVTRLLVLLIALLLVFLILRPANFTNVATWNSMAVQFPEFGLMALGVMLAMITGGIDLSVVGIANMTSIVAATVMLSIIPEDASGGAVALGIAAAMAASLVLGALAGIVNGILVAKVKIPAILVTLGTLELFTGVAIVITAGNPISGLPPSYSAFMAGKVLGVPMQLVTFVVAVLALAVILRRTAFGSKLFMLGTNATNAKFSGLNIDSLLIRTYMLSGIFAALAGLVMLANYNSAKADYGVAYTLLTVLIVVLGGVNPNGGSGRIVGVLLAVATLQVLSSGLNLFPQISNFYRDLIWGSVLLLVIATSDFGGRKLFRKRDRKKKEGVTA